MLLLHARLNTHTQTQPGIIHNDAVKYYARYNSSNSVKHQQITTDSFVFSFSRQSIEDILILYVLTSCHHTRL